MRDEYVGRMQEIRHALRGSGQGLPAVAARTLLVDELLRRLWADVQVEGVAVVAVGGYGRRELYPHSDIDVLFCVEKGAAPKDAIRRVTQALWDCGLRVSPVTRLLGDCERFSADNAEMGFSLLDRRAVTGDASVFAKLDAKVTRMAVRDAKAMRLQLAEMTRDRHRKYGDTLFHLEPNVKECPGGLRDIHVVGWMAQLRSEDGREPAAQEEFEEGAAFLAAARCFLHCRRERDENVLDWTAQDEAAAEGVGIGGQVAAKVDGAYWMRAYFRHVRAVERGLLWAFEAAGMRLHGAAAKRVKFKDNGGLALREGRLELAAALASGEVAAGDPQMVLALFAAMATTGAPMAHTTEAEIAAGIPLLSANLEDGPVLWRGFSAVLTGAFAGTALRSMHALGVLDLILPEFHGIDALVIRDAYHRYTVDEHTFVLIDTLHGLEAEPERAAPEWRQRLGQMARELQPKAALYLAALLHDTGKGRAGERHAEESARLAQAVVARWEMDAYEAGLVLRLIELHLEMSAALRRDIFDKETVRTFAAKMQTHEALRMLTLFTYADIEAVHPDALTPWKAENLWRLSMNAANQMDRSVDEDRVHVRQKDDRVARIVAVLPKQEQGLKAFLEGFPERYLVTRPAEQIARHFTMAAALEEVPLQVLLTAGAAGSRMHEVTVVTRDRPSLFAGIAATLAAWGMDVLTADAFANANSVVVDSFRFVDNFRTLELNESERERFVANLRAVVEGGASVESMLAGRKRARRKAPMFVVETKIEFDAAASSASTLLQVVAQDVPGLLRAISMTLSGLRYNVEVALVDTEGETAIDVFYLTRAGERLTKDEEETLRAALVEAIDENAR